VKILAINGSPRKSKGNTERILAPFLDGAREAGATVDVIYVAEKKIKSCLGCTNCWLKTPGKCVHNDDMPELQKMMHDCEVAVLASPIYIGGVTGQLKTFLDRLITVSMPFLEVVDGYSVHTRHEDSKMKGMVFVSNNGFHELYHFDDLVAHVKSVARMTQVDYLGSLLRPHGVILEMAEKLMPDKVAPVYEAARQAGKELVESGRISAETEAAVAQDLMPRDAFIKAMNDFFHARWDGAKEEAGESK